MEETSLRSYLNRLNNDELLTKNEETEILRRIEDVQDKILSRCVQYKLFRDELASYLSGLSYRKNEDLINLSRRLVVGSPRKLITEIRKDFKKLIKLLATDEDREETRRTMRRLSLTGNHVYKMVDGVKSRFTLLNDYSELKVRMLRYFEVKEEEDLRDLCSRLREDQSYRIEVARSFRTDTASLMNRVLELDKLDQLTTELERAGIDVKEFKELRSTFNVISKLEMDMRKDRNELVQRNLRLVVSRAKRFQNKGLELDDLIQEGNIGLMKAINRHDSSRNIKISTYATWWIDQAIRRGLSKKSRTVRLPAHVEALESQIGEAMHKLYHKLGRTPTVDEVSEQAGIKRSVVENLAASARTHRSGSDPITDDTNLLDAIEADESSDPIHLLEDKMLREKVRLAISKLPPRTQKILRLRFGIGEPYDEQTLDQVGHQVGVCKERVRMLQRSAMHKLSTSKELKDV